MSICEAEYAALRAEMLSWQNRRFSILATAITLTIGVLGLDGVLKGESTVSWGLITSIMWFFLGSVASLSWYASRANAKLAAYISVFHEDQSNGWESRLLDIKNKGLDRLNLNIMMLSIYLGLGIFSFVVPLTIREFKPLDKAELYFLILSGVWYLFFIALLTVKPPRNQYIKQWDVTENT